MRGAPRWDIEKLDVEKGPLNVFQLYEPVEVLAQCLPLSRTAASL
jgi:hypothetical protein